MICEAFAQGCSGVVSDARKGIQEGAAFFYGVVPETLPIWKQVIAEGRDYYYADNAYFDKGRQAYYRVTKNALQLSALAKPDYLRLEAIGGKVRPWRTDGQHIVVCEQSDAFMNLCGYGAGWLDKTVSILKARTKRPLVIRRWNRDKGKMLATLRNDLVNAWCLVTHMSAASNEALLSGVPVIVTGPCAALPMSGKSLDEIDNPVMPDGREAWSAGLAANQWTVDELRNGKCWRELNAG